MAQAERGLNDKSDLAWFSALSLRAPVAAREPLVELAAVQKALSIWLAIVQAAGDDAVAKRISSHAWLLGGIAHEYVAGGSRRGTDRLDYRQCIASTNARPASPHLSNRAIWGPQRLMVNCRGACHIANSVPANGTTFSVAPLMTEWLTTMRSTPPILR